MAGDRFDELERYISKTLDQQERLRLKLLNPLGIGLRLVETTSARPSQGDSTLCGRIGRRLTTSNGSSMCTVPTCRASSSSGWPKSTTFSGSSRTAGSRSSTRPCASAGIPDLLNKARIQREFERSVVGDTPQQIERSVHGVIDWMVASELRQWQAVTEHVNRRRVAHEGRVIGGETGSFQYDREKLINTVGRAATAAVDSYDREREAAEMADSVRAAVAGAALAQVGAVGLGAVVTAVATTTAADVTGILAAGTIAVLGMFVIPSKRTHAKAQLRARIEQMRTELMTNLRAQFEREVDKSVRGVIDAIGPYTRFVRAEHDKLTGLEQEMKEIGGALSRIRVEIERRA